MKKRYIAIALTVVLVVALLSQIDLSKLGDFVRGFSLAGLTAAFAIYALSYFFRALRWRQLIHSKAVGMGELTMITSAHIMFNNLLPSRSGELSYIYLLKKRQGLSGSEGLATLVAARLYDFAVLASFFLVSVFFFWNTSSMSFAELVTGSLVILAVAVALILNLSRFVGWGYSLVKKVALWFKIEQKKAVRYILDKGEETLASFSAMKSKKNFIPLVLTSFCVWGFKFLSYYFMMRAMLAGQEELVPVTYWMIVLGTTAAELTTILPVHGVGGFGTYESAWAGAFFLLGFPKQLAIKAAFSFHLIALIYSVILGVGSLILLRYIKGEKVSPAPPPENKESVKETTLVGRS